MLHTRHEAIRHQPRCAFMSKRQHGVLQSWRLSSMCCRRRSRHGELEREKWLRQTAEFFAHPQATGQTGVGPACWTIVVTQSQGAQSLCRCRVPTPEALSTGLVQPTWTALSSRKTKILPRSVPSISSQRIAFAISLFLFFTSNLIWSRRLDFGSSDATPDRAFSP